MTEYSGAIQNAAHSFRLPALAGAEFETLAMMGLPAFASGQNAVVFSAKIGNTRTAVRCFTSPSHDGRRRYQALEQHLRDHPVGQMARASWVDDAIEVNGQVWPIVTMDWIDGAQLHDWVGDHVTNINALSQLAEAWMTTCSSLRSAEVTHGDLQHGNVLVDQAGHVRLIDFDGVWLREIEDSPPSEAGHPNYQHPDRSKSGAWGWSIDWFSALGVLVSLRALAADPSLWEFHNGENLIFKESDYWGDAEVWNLLERSPDNEVVALSRLLAQGCGHPCDAPYDLPTIVEKGLFEVAGPTTPATSSAEQSTSSTTTSNRTEPNSENSENSGRESSLGGDASTAWWFDPSSLATQVPSPPPPAPRPQPSGVAAPGEINFVWVTGPSSTADAADTTPNQARKTPSARPPERERPPEQAVQSDWTDSGAPPPPNTRQPNPPMAHQSTQQPPGAPQTHSNAGLRPPTRGKPRPFLSGMSIGTYLLIIIVFVIIGVLIGTITAGF